jgi:hypothetical protein
VDLVGGLFDQEEFEQSPLLGTSDDTAGGPILFEERTRRPHTKLCNETIALVLINRRGTDSFALYEGGTGIINRPNKPGHVAQWAGLGTALFN